MGKKRFKLAIGIAVIIILSGAAVLLYLKSADQAALNQTGPPKTARQLRAVVKKITRLDAPACKDIDKKKGEPDQLWLECFKQAYEEPSIRIYSIEDANLLPALVKVASNTKFKYPSNLPKDPDIRRKYRLLACSVRFTAVQTLGKMGDPRAIDPMLKIMAEPYDTSSVGCFFGGGTSMCTITARELSKFQDPGVPEMLIRNLEQHPYKTHTELEEEISKTQGGPGFSEEDSWVKYQDTNISECNIQTLFDLDEDGRQAIIRELKTGKLNSAQLQLFLDFAGKMKLDQGGFEAVKKYLTYESKPVREAAAQALAKNANKQQKDLFLDLYQQGLYRQAAEAFGKIKSPELVPVLIEILKKSDDEETVKAVCIALKQYKPEEIRPAVAVLMPKLKKNREMVTDPYYDVLKKAKDPAVIKDLVEMLHNPDQAMGIQIDTVGAIGGAEAKSALRRIMEEKNYALDVLKDRPTTGAEGEENLSRLQRIRVKAMFWYLVLEGESAKTYCKKYFDPKLVDSQWLLAEQKRKQISSPTGASAPL
jgi:HEAT repeat protein